jgi:heat shock protein HslJ
MKTLKFLLFILIGAASYTGCSENQGISDNNENENISLAGTQWKLVGFVNGADGAVITPEASSGKPYNFYWIQFKEDKTVNGMSSSNQLLGSYDVNSDASEIQIKSATATEVMERPDGILFVERLNAVRSFEYRESALLLYYNETDYLLFEIYGDEKELEIK